MKTKDSERPLPCMAEWATTGCGVLIGLATVLFALWLVYVLLGLLIDRH